MELGSFGAQHLLSCNYDDGAGVRENDAEAVKWYLSAANQGEFSAQYALGVMYESGEGVPTDYVQAYKWYNLAAAQDTEAAEIAKRTKNNLHSKMTREQIAEAQRLSSEWKPKTN